MNNFHYQKNLWLNKWRGKTLIAFCAIAILGGVIGARTASLSEEKQQEQHQRQEQRTEREEPKTSPPPLHENGHAAEPPKSEGKDKYDPEKLRRMYHSVEVGMTEAEVRKLLGDPVTMNETWVENHGMIKYMIYPEGVSTSLNDVTVVIHNDKVELVVYQYYGEGHKEVRAKK